MRVQIAARHCDVPEAVRRRTEEQVKHLDKYDPRISAAEVVFEEEKRTKKVEIVLSVDRSEPVVAHGEGEEFRAALDKAVDRLARILRKQRSQAKDHQATKLSEEVTG